MGRLWVSERDAVGYAFEPLSVKEAKRTCGPSDAEYALWPKFSPCDVAKHSTLNDGWVIVFERVFDITTFALTHPGFHNAGQSSWPARFRPRQHRSLPSCPSFFCARA
jgi:hypothetical protein